MFRENHYELMKKPKAKLRNRKRDLMRWSEKYGIPFQIPREFPIKSSRALRGSLAMRRFDQELPFVEVVMDRYWVRADASIATYEGLRPIAQSLGVDPGEFEQLSASEEIGAELAASTNRGIERDVLGVPMIIVGDELFWGKDRVEFVEDELHRETGVIYTTNAIENMNRQLRKIIKNRGQFPSDEAAIKLLWLALRNVLAKP